MDAGTAQVEMTNKVFSSDILSPLEALRACNICPRKCNANRFSSKKGYCRSGTGFSISSICIHKGEEPVISGSSGICNVFFSNCNLRCVFCQNWQISQGKVEKVADDMALEDVVNQIINILDQGIHMLGFVSPGHFIPQMKIIIHALDELGYHPTIVYNSNGYDDVDQLKMLEGMVDVYLPDFKYMDAGIAGKYSDAKDYPEIAIKAHREMYRQKGSTFIVNEEGYAGSGMLIRHLVLPGHMDNSISVLENIAEQLSPNVHISLMSQYYPAYKADEYPLLNKSVDPDEYYKIVKKMNELGFGKGFIQGMESSCNYRPDFDLKHPFE
jgi:putative pyruvate formate lyase activating enzyme